MSETRPASFIVDIEGTLIDCVRQILECWQSVLKANGHDLSVETLQSYSGMDPNDMLAELIPSESKERKTQMVKQQEKEYRNSYLPRVKKLSGVRGLLQELKKRGYAIALATTCDSMELCHYCTLMEVDDLIDAIACRDDVKHGKPHPDLFRLALKRLGETAAFGVGDTPYDAIAATQTGTRPLGLFSGGFSRAKLLDAGCVAVFENPKHLLKDGVCLDGLL
jgi:HAD superfamily hydrolase (TIGR01549 family)